ncbi:MAG TPA: zinc ribbon domain-containing protein, partial [Polyangiaceae bacterium]
MEARVYRCSACGAPARESSRSCEYCRSPVATVRCARCFHMNPPDARHCSACGTELGLEPLEGVSEANCTSCSVRLVELDSGCGPIGDCPRCGG